MLVTVLIAIFVLALIGAYVVKYYNTLVDLHQMLQQSEADVEVPLRRRLDLIPNIVGVVEGYVDHEHSTLVDVAQARSQVEQSGLMDLKAQVAMTSALGKIMALSEAYPALQANTNFEMLQRELASTENDIANARRTYNEVCAVYNTGRSVFPNVIVAEAFGFNKAEFLDADIGATQSLLITPKVDFRSGRAMPTVA